MIIKKEHLETISNIFTKISEIDITLKEIKNNNNMPDVLPIIFHSEIKFINPLFIALLLQTHEKYIKGKIALVIDILEFNQDDIYSPKIDPRQHFIFRLLLPFLNTPHFKLEFIQSDIKSIKERDEKIYKLIIPSKIKNYTFVEQKTERTFSKLIYLFYNKKHGDSIFLKDDEYRHLLPIIKLTNYPNFYYNEDFYNDSKDKFDQRKDIFKSITIEDSYSSSELKKVFESKFIDIIKSTKDSNSLSQPLKDIFFEMVDNIKRHAKYDTGEYADSYFNFYYDKKEKAYKFYIVDNLSTGFINKYIETLTKDKKMFHQKNLDGESIYASALKALNNPTYDIEFLTLFFSEHGWFYAHQIPRIIMHFGIPLLVEIIKNLSGSAYIRLHRKDKSGNKFYEIEIDKTGTRAKDITDGREHIEGTYIAITIPDQMYQSPSPLRMVLDKKDYQNIDAKKNNGIKQVNDFLSESKKTKERKYAIYDFKKEQDKTISDFIRKIYFDAYTRNTYDILVLNIPLKRYAEYFRSLSYLLYSKDYKLTQENENNFHPVINVLFWDNASFNIFFIGGKNRLEFCKSNQLLYQHYGQENYFFSEELCLECSDSPAESIFFFKTAKDDFIVLPFELLSDEIEDKRLENISIQRTIIEHLKLKKKNIHFDTQRGFHVGEYYKFDTIFQDSTFFGRIVYELKDRIIKNDKFNNKKLVFIGIGKYLNLFMALLLQYLEDKKLNICDRYEIFDISSDKNEKMKNFIMNSKKGNKDFVFIIVTAVSFNGDKVNDFIDKFLYADIVYWYNIIQIKLENYSFSKQKTVENIINIEIPKNAYHSTENNFCSICENPETEIPLLKIDDNDEFKLEKTYFGKYQSKNLVDTKKIDDLKWYNAIAFGHIKRGSSNHYLYYTKTINFFTDNQDNISLFLEKNIAKVDNPANSILLVPMHCTLNRFVSLVHKIVFSGKANIFQLDKKKGVKNFHELKEQLTEPHKYKFYFIDDEISSGYTLEYFYSLLKYLEVDVFEKIFILIDRMDNVEEKLILNFVRNKSYNNIHCFSKMEIKPIKTEVESCFLCETREEYEKILQNTALDMNRFAIAKRIVKLNLIDSKQVDFENSKVFNVSDFRTYLKMYAVDYVYEKFDDFYFNDLTYSREDIIEKYKKQELKFIERVQKKIKLLGFNSLEKYENILNEIGEYEGRIALLKALSFPKLVYYYPIRYTLTVVLIHSIKSYIKKDAVEYYFNRETINKFLELQNNENHKDFLKHFASKINMHYLSFLYKTAAYLNIHYVLHKENVEYYFKASRQIKERDEGKVNQNDIIDQSLVEYYQLAAKTVASYSADRAKYLKDSIDHVFKINKNSLDQGYSSLLGALLIENHYDKELINFQDECSMLFTQDNDFQDIISNIEERLKKLIDDDTLKINSVYINQYTNLTYKTYSNYLNNIKLVDVLDNYEEPFYSSSDIVYRLTKGYLSKKSDEIFDPSNYVHLKYIHNTWSNLYIKKYLTKDNKVFSATAIKLVDINPTHLNTDPKERVDSDIFVKENNILWFKPIGCLVVTYNEYTKKNHLRLSKYILSVQNIFVKYLNEKFSHGVIQKEIQNKYIRESHDKLQEILEHVSHTYGKYIKIADHIVALENYKEDGKRKYPDQAILEMVKKYTRGLEYVFTIGSLVSEKTINSLDEIALSNDFIKTIEGFLEVAPVFKEKNPNTDTVKKAFKMKYVISYQENTKSIFLYFQNKEEDLKAIIFELIFNAIRSNQNIDRLELELCLSEQYISIKNSGKPITNIEKIFTKNYSENKGSGIGLYNIQEYLKNSNMIIEAKNLENENLYNVEFIIRRKQ